MIFHVLVSSVRHSFFLGVGGLVLAAAWLTLAGRADSPNLVVSDLAGNGALERETFALINQYRKANQLAPFVWDATISKTARAHSKDMASGEVDFGHEGFGDRMSHLRKALFGMRGGGENVFMTDNPERVAEMAVAGWLQSPPHLHNIRGDYNYSGMGIWRNDQGVIYFTQIFVKLQPATKATAPDQVLLPGFISVPPQTGP